MSKKFEEVQVIIAAMIVDLKGVDREYVSDEDYDEQVDEMYQAPRYVTTDKNGHFHIEYVMMSVAKGGVICARGLGENCGDAEVKMVDDLSWGDVISMHDITFTED